MREGSGTVPKGAQVARLKHCRGNVGLFSPVVFSRYEPTAAKSRGTIRAAAFVGEVEPLLQGRCRAEEGVPLLQALRTLPPRCWTGTRCSCPQVGPGPDRPRCARPRRAQPRVTRRALGAPGGLRGRVPARSLLYGPHRQRSPLRPLPRQSGQHERDQDLRRQLADVGGSGGAVGLTPHPSAGPGRGFRRPLSRSLQEGLGPVWVVGLVRAGRVRKGRSSLTLFPLLSRFLNTVA